MLINIIHPYTYKLIVENGDLGLHIGPCDAYLERDEKIAEFVQTALENKSSVLLHKAFNGNTFNSMMEDLSLSTDPQFYFVTDKRIESITTTPGGIPIPDEKYDSITDEAWDILKSSFTSHSQLGNKINGKKHVIFIGGVLENCVSNAMHYFYSNYTNEPIFYVPELCVSLDPLLRRKVLMTLENKIVPLSYTDALQLVTYEKN